MNLYTLDDYKKHFEDCKRCLDLAREIMNREELRQVTSPLAIKECRKGLLRLFSKPEFYQICHECGGRCCRSHQFSLKPIELLYFVAENLRFEFPEPDWQFLEKGEIVNGKNRFSDSSCLFLTDQRCLLKEYRPEICLKFYGQGGEFQICNLKESVEELYSSPERNELFFVQMTRYGQAIETFCEEILKARGISKESTLYAEINGELMMGTVGFRVCMEAFERLAK